ncbi:MAG: ATP-binding protein [Acidimicrobiales bacterium]
MGYAVRAGRVTRRRGLPPAHRATTAEVRSIYPFVAPEPLGAQTCYLGREATGSAFCFDPWECYEAGVLTGPNMVVMGQIGRGKSAFVKSFIWRQLAFGRQCWVLDPKGEYGGLAAACGTVPLKIGPGAGLRLNPFDAAPTDAGRGHQGRCELLAALLASSLGRALLPEERAAADVALGAAEARARVPTLPLVAEALLNPEESQARLLGTDAQGLRQDGRQLALELRRLVQGDLAGMFDGETTPGTDLGGRLVVLDLSLIYGSPALGLLMVCAMSWLQSALLSRDSGRTAKRLLVLDEAWALLSQLETAEWLRATFKLSRSYGVANIAVVHRLSDLRAAGREGSQQERLAVGLLSDAETRVVFGQAAADAEQAGRLLGLSGTEVELLGQLPRGVALWKVGSRSYLVEHDLSPKELALTDTDSAMR